MVGRSQQPMSAECHWNNVERSWLGGLTTIYTVRMEIVISGLSIDGCLTQKLGFGDHAKSAECID